MFVELSILKINVQNQFIFFKNNKEEVIQKKGDYSFKIVFPL